MQKQKLRAAALQAGPGGLFVCAVTAHLTLLASPAPAGPPFGQLSSFPFSPAGLLNPNELASRFLIDFATVLTHFRDGEEFVVSPADSLISQGNKYPQLSGGILGISGAFQLFLLSVFSK